MRFQEDRKQEMARKTLGQALCILLEKLYEAIESVRKPDLEKSVKNGVAF